MLPLGADVGRERVAVTEPFTMVKTEFAWILSERATHRHASVGVQG